MRARLLIAGTALACAACQGSGSSGAVTPAVALGYVLQPVNSDACATLPPVQVHAVADNSAPVPSYAGDITIGIAPGTGAPTAILSGKRTVTAVNGVAVFADLSISIPGTGFRLYASAPDVSGTASQAFTVAAGGAAKLAFATSPSTVVTGGALPTVRVAVQDACGSTLPGATSLVTIAFGTNAGAATLSGTTAMVAAGGIATFSDLFVSRPGAAYTLAASSTGLAGATSTAFTVAPAPASSSSR